MLETTYICDLCKKQITSQQGHASAVVNDNSKLNYKYIDKVSFPIGWVNIGFSAICKECAALTKTVLDTSSS